MSTAKQVRHLFLAATLGLFATAATLPVNAQKKIDSTIKKIGNKTASVAVKGASTITDKVYKGKEGPDGQTVYIDKKDRKYFVDDKGKKIYLKPSQIKNKAER